MTSRPPIRSVLIQGYGVMGRGVARTFADAGFVTSVRSRRAADLDDLPPGVAASADLPIDPPDLVIELVPEEVQVKQAVYRELEAAYPPPTIIATGTSGLDLVELASGMRHPERFVGVHYFMPADATPVVESMAGPAAPPDVVDAVTDALRATGKEVVTLYKPIVGFLINRLQHAILHEAYYLVEAGVSGAEDIDLAARAMLGPRMCLNGLIQQKDISGLRINGLAQRSIVPELFHNGVPNPLLQRMIEDGETGLDAGKGFYDWDGCDIEAVRRQASEQLRKVLRFLDTELGPPEANTTPKPRDVSGGGKD